MESYKLNQWLDIPSFCFRDVVGGRTLGLILHDRPRAFTEAIFCFACKMTELSFQKLRNTSSSIDKSSEIAGKLDVPQHELRSL